jgi:hypothetical protein
MSHGMSHQPARGSLAPIIRPTRDPEASLRRASALLEEGGLKEAAHWTRLAADAIAEHKRGH